MPGGDTPRRLTDSVLERSSVVLSGLAYNPADGPSVQQLVIDCDDALFVQIQTNEHHIIREELLSNTTDHPYGLRNRRHNYILDIKTAIDERNFITRLLFRDTY